MAAGKIMLVLVGLIVLIPPSVLSRRGAHAGVEK
jgi:hypothetical protein